MPDVIEQKKLLRKEMHRIRANQDPIQKAAYDAAICRQLFDLINQRNATVIHAYIPLGSEIDIKPLLQTLLSQQYLVVSPRTRPNHILENRVLNSLDSLATGIMGTQHPKEKHIYTDHYDFIIVPGLAFDNKRYRLGYGGGYYDTFLAKAKGAYKTGIFYPFQEVVEVPREPHDFQLDQIMLAAL